MKTFLSIISRATLVFSVGILLARSFQPETIMSSALVLVVVSVGTIFVLEPLY